MSDFIDDWSAENEKRAYDDVMALFHALYANGISLDDAIRWTLQAESGRSMQPVAVLYGTSDHSTPTDWDRVRTAPIEAAQQGHDRAVELLRAHPDDPSLVENIKVITAETVDHLSYEHAAVQLVRRHLDAMGIEGTVERRDYELSVVTPDATFKTVIPSLVQTGPKGGQYSGGGSSEIYQRLMWAVMLLHDRRRKLATQ
jgi:hypothetical protein